MGSPQLLAATSWLLLLVGCSKPPAMPQLRSSTPAMERFVLHEGLAPKDVRELFRAVNRDGRLNALVPYFEEPTDEAMQTLGSVTDRHLYRDVFSDEGFLQIVEARNRKRSFTDIRDRAVRWMGEKTAPQEKRAVFSAMSLPGWPELFRRDVGFFALPFAKAVHNANENSKAGFKATKQWPEAPPFDAEATVADFRRLLAETSTVESLDAVVKLLAEQSFPTHLMDAAREALAKRGMLAFEGFGYGLARMLATPSEAKNPESEDRLNAFLRLVRILDAPSNGLFKTAEKALRDRGDLAREFAALFQPEVAISVEGYLYDLLSQPPKAGSDPYGRSFWIPATPGQPTTEEHLALFIGLRSGIENLTGGSRPETARDYFLGNLALFANTYALEKWVQKVIETNRSRFDKLQKETFGQAIWSDKTTVTYPAFSVNFVEKDEHGVPRVAKTVRTDFESIGLNAFVNDLDVAVKGESFGSWIYRFPAAKGSTFKGAFRGAIRACQATRSFGDPSILLRDVLYRLTHKSSGSPLTLADLETGKDETVLDLLQRGLQGLNEEGWRRVRHVIFDQLKLADPNDTSTRKLIRSLFKDAPEHDKRVAALFDGLPAFLDFDTPSPDVDSPFALYHRALSWITPREVHVPAALLSFLFDGKIIAKEGASPRYASLHAFVNGGKPITRATHFFASFVDGEAADFRRPFAAMLGGDGMRKHREMLRAWLERAPDGTAALLRKLADGVFSEVIEPDFLTAAEREWLRRFIESGDLKKLWDFMDRYSSRPKLLKLVQDLRGLARSGYLRDAFALLNQVRNDRIRELSRVLGEWEASGELARSLEAMELFLQP